MAARINLLEWVNARHDVGNDLTAIILVAKMLIRPFTSPPGRSLSLQRNPLACETHPRPPVGTYHGKHKPFDNSPLRNSVAITKQIPYSRENS